jgi:hypothetical protein
MQTYDHWPTVLVQSNQSRWMDMLARSGMDADRATRARPTMVKFVPYVPQTGGGIIVDLDDLDVFDNESDRATAAAAVQQQQVEEKRPKLCRLLANITLENCKYPYPDHSESVSTIEDLGDWMYHDLERLLRLAAKPYGLCSWKFYFPPPECVVVAAMSRGIPVSWLALNDSGYTEVRISPPLFFIEKAHICNQGALNDVLSRVKERLVADGLRIRESALSVGSKGCIVPCWDVSWRHAVDKKRQESYFKKAPVEVTQVASGEIGELPPVPRLTLEKKMKRE